MLSLTYFSDTENTVTSAVKRTSGLLDLDMRVFPNVNIRIMLAFVIHLEILSCISNAIVMSSGRYTHNKHYVHEFFQLRHLGLLPSGHA